MNVVVKCFFTNENPFILLEKVRGISRQILAGRLCASFTAINRAEEDRIDAYLFEVEVPGAGLRNLFEELQLPRVEISEIQMSPELILVKEAGVVVEVLLNNYSKDHRHKALLLSNLHYIINSLGNTYESEAKIYHEFYQIVSKKAGSAKASQHL